MKRGRTVIKILSLLALIAGILMGPDTASAVCIKNPNTSFTTRLMQGDCRGFHSLGANPFFILKPGYELVLDGTEEGVLIRLTITVLNETKTVDGIETRVVKEEETHDGELVEVSKNYFAICSRTNAVFYFGEDVDIYEGGVIIGHEGSWLAGVGGDRAGIVMPGDILNGAQYYQEVAPLVALDRALIQGTNFTVDPPAGTFTNCLKTVETTPLEPDAIECKFYARGIGIVMDGVLKLTTYSPK